MTESNPTAAPVVQPGEVTFSLATEAEVDAVVALVQAAYRGEVSRQGWTSEADLLDGQRTDPAMVRELLATPGAHILLVRHQADLVGCCELRHLSEARRAYLGMFAVDPARQGQGLGSAVLAEAERIARGEWGTTHLELTVIDVRDDLLAWYRSRGYELTGETAPFPYGDERFGIPRRDDLRFVKLARELRRPTRWETDTGEGHAQWYIERFRAMAAQGDDLAGEARFIHALVPRASRILDAGCGPGRVGGELHALGHQVVGVDVDPELIAAAEADHPGPHWMVGDIAHLDLAPRGEAEPFALAFLAGNVLAFIAPGTEAQVLSRVAAHVVPDGAVVVGFHVNRVPLDYFDRAVAEAGLTLEHRFATWDIRRWHDDADFAVSVLRTPRPD